MAEVTISINGRAYDIACDHGQEERVIDLAAYIDHKLQTIARSGGAYNDPHLLVLSALVIADELFEAREASARRQEIATHPAETEADMEEEQVVVNALESLAKRIEGIAARVQSAA